jgi:hypothetical protein
MSDQNNSRNSSAWARAPSGPLRQRPVWIGGLESPLLDADLPAGLFSEAGVCGLAGPAGSGTSPFFARQSLNQASRLPFIGTAPGRFHGYTMYA